MQIGQAKYTDCHITSCCNNAEALKANTKSFNQQGAVEKTKKYFYVLIKPIVYLARLYTLSFIRKVL